ncbi:Phosphoglucomutase/phosphomannomutase [Corynebacterium kutscheri]|uniref:Phosphoglucomutase/phosphomannomutase n=2 Tax=Corynebacterium kutscheri TaxID=35755 RepID=A0AB38VP65_9CORY|nr:Phosphoglucomutase/phosphomannomutase [Corynebacterium kutscheri]VEH80453.1 Phosphoglucomutase/phosphomannomutase [Corynebacterium kutscheri]
MTARLTFGTAGLRAPIGPAEHQMNVQQVSRISSAVATWLAKQAAQHPHEHPAFPENELSGIHSSFRHEDSAPRVVVGYDARYGSHAFATAAAEVFAGAGFEVFLMPTPTPTPMVPWLIKQWDLSGGIQITASHNSAADNGYKVYMANGRQLCSEGAHEIEKLLESTPAATDIPRVFVRPAPDMSRRYIDDCVNLIVPEQSDLLRVNAERSQIKIAFSAMHGVGGRTLKHSLQVAGFAQVFPLAEQLHPDPSFPTVNFPNPEEPEAVRALLEFGQHVCADILIALDPDADRCAVGIRKHNGDYVMLRGDETGPLLATHLVPEYTGQGKRPVVSTTFVSSQLLESIALDKGWDFRTTLTGFKNLMNAADQVDYACEESVGIAPAPQLVDDKDGIITALYICAWAAELKARGLTLGDEMDLLYRRYGIFAGKQIAFRTGHPEELISALEKNMPHTLGGITITRCPFNAPLAVIHLRGTNEQAQLRILARASGTESKAKVYVEVSQTDTMDTARAILHTVVEEMTKHLAQL